MRKLAFAAILISITYLAYINYYPSNTSENFVTIYVAHDQDYSAPVLEEFENQTGITVKAVYDTEASKTVGLTNRLIAEKNNPQADVFWNNEVTRSIQLKKEDILQPYQPSNFDEIDSVHKDAEGYWTGFAARARVLVVSSDLLSVMDVVEIPETLQQIIDYGYADFATIADPRFGTTGSHIAALYSVWGKDKTEAYFQELLDKGLDVAQSNGQTRDKVVSAEELVGFTDTDDANDAVVSGESIVVIYPDQGDDEIGTLVIPNTAMLIKGAKNEENAKKLIDYLVSAEVESKLAYAKSAQMPLLPEVDRPETVPDMSEIKAMDVDWEEVYSNLDSTLQFVEESFFK